MSTNRRRATRVLIVNPHHPEPDLIGAAAAVLRDGGTVAFPTETVYGLGANALDATAVERVFLAKGRPASDPLIVHLASAGDVARVARAIPEPARLLAARFWPGPLSLVLPKRPEVPDSVTAGLPSVAVRVPSHPVALALLRAAGTPVAAPSANRFGHTSPTTAAHVLDDLDGRIDLVLDGGAAAIGVESTVLDLTGDRPVLLRPGGVTVEQLREVVGDTLIVQAGTVTEQRAAPSPGLLTSHYAPRAELRLFSGPRQTVLAAMKAAVSEEVKKGRRAGLLLTDEEARELEAVQQEGMIEALGPASRSDLQANRLFAAMRRLDRAGVSVIMARLPDEQGLGRAIADRLRRAAGGRIHTVGDPSKDVG